MRDVGLPPPFATMLLISVVLVAFGVALSFFPDTTVMLSDRMNVLVPGNLGVASTVAWLAADEAMGLVCLAAGLFLLLRRVNRPGVKKSW